MCSLVECVSHFSHHSLNHSSHLCPCRKLGGGVRGGAGVCVGGTGVLYRAEVGGGIILGGGLLPVSIPAECTFQQYSSSLPFAASSSSILFYHVHSTKPSSSILHQISPAALSLTPTSYPLYPHQSPSMSNIRIVSSLI